MAGGNEAQRSNRFDLPKNMAFTFIIRICWQFHAVTALRFVPACHNMSSKGKYKWTFVTQKKNRRLKQRLKLRLDARGKNTKQKTNN
jgi:hypothetical protein